MAWKYKNTSEIFKISDVCVYGPFSLCILGNLMTTSVGEGKFDFDLHRLDDAYLHRTGSVVDGVHLKMSSSWGLPMI